MTRGISPPCRSLYAFINVLRWACSNQTASHFSEHETWICLPHVPWTSMWSLFSVAQWTTDTKTGQGVENFRWVPSSHPYPLSHTDTCPRESYTQLPVCLLLFLTASTRTTDKIEKLKLTCKHKQIINILMINWSAFLLCRVHLLSAGATCVATSSLVSDCVLIRAHHRQKEKQSSPANTNKWLLY